MKLSFCEHFSPQVQSGVKFILYLNNWINSYFFIYTAFQIFSVRYRRNKFFIISTWSSIFTVNIYPTIFSQTTKNHKLYIYLLPILIVITTYISFDIFFSFFVRTPRVQDFYNIFLVFKFDTSLGIKIFAFIISFVFFIFFLLYKINPNKKTIFPRQYSTKTQCLHCYSRKFSWPPTHSRHTFRQVSSLSRTFIILTESKRKTKFFSCNFSCLWRRNCTSRIWNFNGNSCISKIWRFRI